MAGEGGSPRLRRGWRIAIALLALGVPAAVFLLQGHKLHWRGEYTLGPGPLSTFHVANRSTEPHKLKVSGRDGSAIDLVLEARSGATLQVPAEEHGMVRVESRRVRTEGPTCVERSLDWTTMENEEIRITIAADGSETRQIFPTSPEYGAGRAGLTIRTETEAPVLAFFNDLAAADSVTMWDAAHQPIPAWIGLGTDGSLRGTPLRPGVDLHFHYRITSLGDPTTASMDASPGSSGEAVIESDGSFHISGTSLVTLAGF